jgi:hypothetical protein
MKRGNFFSGLSKKSGGREKIRAGWRGWAVTILDREDAASCGRRTGLFYLAKDARRGEPQHQGKWGGQDSGVRWSGLLAGVNAATSDDFARRLPLPEFAEPFGGKIF